MIEWLAGSKAALVAVYTVGVLVALYLAALLVYLVHQVKAQRDTLGKVGEYFDRNLPVPHECGDCETTDGGLCRRHRLALEVHAAAAGVPPEFILDDWREARNRGRQPRNGAR